MIIHDDDDDENDDDDDDDDDALVASLEGRRAGSARGNDCLTTSWPTVESWLVSRPARLWTPAIVKPR